jgi:glycosyltransferase involved in cell wall biosynthesis
MRILFFIPSLDGGGAERVTAALANYWASRGWDVTLVTLESTSVDRYPVRQEIRRVALGLTSTSSSVVDGLVENSRRIGALRRVLRELRPDVAVALMSTCSVLLGCAAAGITGVVTIGAERVYPPLMPLGRGWGWMRSRTYRFLDTVVVQTEKTAEWVRRHTNAARIAVIPNAVQWPLPDTPPRVSPDSVGRPGNRRLVAAGRLEHQKGFDLLIDAFAEIAPSVPEWELCIAGAGSLRGELERHIRAANLEDRVFLAGRVGNMADWYETSDAFVTSSRFEGFPNTLLEAMAYGLPVVAFDCDTGPSDIIAHEENGLLVPVGDRVALARTLKRLLSDQDLRQALRERAVDVRTRFSFEAIAGQWETTFCDLQKT